MDNHIRKNHLLFQYLQGATAEITFGFGKSWGPKKEYILCECGRRYKDSVACIKIHNDTKNHLKYLKEKDYEELIELEREFEELIQTDSEKQNNNNSILKDNDNRNIKIKRYIHTVNYAERNKRNKTGVKGVYPSKNGFISQIIHLGKIHYLGTFKTIEEAKEARQKKSNELFVN